jgi:hypothetical protein
MRRKRMKKLDARILLAPLLDDGAMRYAAKYWQESGFELHGNVWTTHSRGGRIIHGPFDQGPNTFTTEGMTHMLDVYFRAQTGPTAVYVGIFKNNVSPALGDTATAKLGAAGTYGECQDADYDDPATNRPAYTVAAASASAVTNTASKAEFTIAGSITVYGAFVTTTQAKTDTSGKLVCAKKFTASRAVIDNDVLAVTYAISATTS